MAKKRPIKWLRILLRALLVLFVVFNTSMAFNAWKFTHYYNDPGLRQHPPKGTLSLVNTIFFGRKVPKKLNDSVPAWPYTIKKIRTGDGILLECWSLQPRVGTTDSNNAGGRQSPPATVILFHGHGSCKSALLPEAYAFLNLGFGVLMVDFRAHGGSEGSQTTIGIKEAEDVSSVYHFVKTRTGKEPVLFGVSMGAAAIIRCVATKGISPSKLVLEMPFATLNDAVKGFIRTHARGMPEALAPFISFWGGILNGEWAFTHQPAEFGKKITCPVLLQWGAKDQRVKEMETNDIFGKLGSTEKKLVIYQECGHESLYAREPAKWVETVLAFLKR